MRSAHALHLPNRILVHPLNQTMDGIWIAAPPYFVLDLEATAELIGDAVLSALENSTKPVVHPKDWNSVTKKRLAAAGVSSEAKLQSLARLVHVRVEHGQAIVTPTHNGGAKGSAKGFTELNAQAVAIPRDKRSVGVAIAAAFSKCTR